jgi:hypothetical protein
MRGGMVLGSYCMRERGFDVGFTFYFRGGVLALWCSFCMREREFEVGYFFYFH